MGQGCASRPHSSTWSTSRACTTGTPAPTPAPPSAMCAVKLFQGSPPMASPVKVSAGVLLGDGQGLGSEQGSLSRHLLEQVWCRVMPTACHPQMQRGLGPGLCMLWGPSLLLTAPLHAVCKFKAHKRCAVRATNNCKWTTLASIGIEIIEDEDGVSKGVPVRDPDRTEPPAELALLCPDQEAGRNRSCPLRCVASALGSAGTQLGDTSSDTLYQDPFLLSKRGHLQAFSGDMSALPHVLMASRGQAGGDERA